MSDDVKLELVSYLMGEKLTYAQLAADVRESNNGDYSS